VVVAFFLKAAIAPFHAWAPDAYEGTSVPVTDVHGDDREGRGAAGGGAPLRLAPLSAPWWDVVAILPLVSIVWGNLAAMRQPGLRG
jgi:NADH-quinone oxidoreductase subunit N